MGEFVVYSDGLEAALNSGGYMLNAVPDSVVLHNYGLEVSY